MYRIGNFRLLPGEPAKVLGGVVIGFLTLLGFFLLLDALPPSLDLVVSFIAVIATIGFARVARQRSARYEQSLPEDQRAEIAKRAEFFRSRPGRAWFVAFGAGIVVWATLLAGIFR